MMDVPDLIRVWDDLPCRWQQEILRNRQTPVEVKWHAVKLFPFWVEIVGYVSDDVAPETLWDLILHQALDAGGVHGFIAGHPALSEDMLLVLCDLCKVYGTEAILDNKNATPAVMSRLENYPDHDDIRRRARKATRAARVLPGVFQKLGPQFRTWPDED